MKKIRRNTAICISLCLSTWLFYSSCFPFITWTNGVSKKSTVKFDTRTGKNISGLYTAKKTYRHDLFFQEDGEVVSGTLDEENIYNELKRASLSEFGIYVLSNDTIYVDFYIRDINAYFLWRIWKWQQHRFKILNDSTMVQFLRYDAWIHEYVETNDTFCLRKDVHFPNHEFFHKSERWLWKSRKEWKKYIKAKKQEKPIDDIYEIIKAKEQEKPIEDIYEIIR